MRRNSTALLHRADQLRDEGDLKAEAKTLRSYLSLNPLDDAVLARLALTLDESADDPAKKAAAVQVLYRALAQPANSQRADLRRRQLRLLWETRRFEDAIEQSQYVLKVLADPDDALHREALVVQALAEVDSAASSPLGETGRGSLVCLAMRLPPTHLSSTTWSWPIAWPQSIQTRRCRSWCPISPTRRPPRR